MVNRAAERSSWWPAATLGVLIGIVFGAGVFAVAMFMSTAEVNEQPARTGPAEVSNPYPNRAVARTNTAPTPEPEPSPSPEAEAEAEAEPSPATNTENTTATVQLNQGPISTGQKTSAGDSESNLQTVIEMNDGSTLDVEAAWEDKQGIWYRRSGLVSFVDAARVKAIKSRPGTKAADGPHR